MNALCKTFPLNYKCEPITDNVPRGTRFYADCGQEPFPEVEIINNPFSEKKKLQMNEDFGNRDLARGIQVAMDRKPYVSDRNNDNVKALYHDYKNIKFGNIQYYEDPLFSSTLHLPNYVMTANQKSSVFFDPMDSIKPQYRRQQLLSKDASEYQVYRDEMGHRENLMHSQSAVRYQSDRLAFESSK